jgi:hypothetical protein
VALFAVLLVLLMSVLIQRRLKCEPAVKNQSHGMLADVGISFFKMPHGFLHLVSVPPNTLQILSEVFMFWT